MYNHTSFKKDINATRKIEINQHRNNKVKHSNTAQDLYLFNFKEYINHYYKNYKMQNLFATLLKHGCHA